MSLHFLPSKRLLRKDRFFFMWSNRNQRHLNGRQDGGKGADVPLVEVEEGVGEILDGLVRIDVGHSKQRGGRGRGE